MVLGDDAALEQWRPNFSSSGQANPAWTRVTWSKVVLCNSLEWVQWLENPVQVELCDACGTAGCASGSYVHVSRLGAHVLWTPPQVDELDEWTRDRHRTAWPIRRFGPIVISDSTWERWRDSVPQLPELSRLPRTTSRAVLDAWLLGFKGERNAKTLLASLESRVLGADSFDAGTALQLIEKTLTELTRDAGNPLDGRLARAADVGARVEVLYFDGPADDDWPALAVIGEQIVPAFSREWVYVPA